MSKFTLEFGPKSASRLEEIARKKEVSRADVVRRALEFYDGVLEATGDDGKVLIESKDGTRKEILAI